MKKIARIWEAHFLLAESLLSFVIGILFALWVLRYGGGAVLDTLLKGNRAAIYGAVAAIFGSLLGFLITAVSIVLGFAASDRLAVVRDSPHYSTLWKAFMSAIRVFGLATAMALTGLVVDREDRPIHAFLCIVFFFSILAVFRLVRCVWVLERIILIVTKKV